MTMAWADRRRALLVAVSAYDDPGLQTLHAPAGDAARLREVLLNPRRAAIAPDAMSVVCDPELIALQRALGDFTATAEPDDLLVLYFSGHAILHDGHVFLACRDTNPAQPWSTALPGAVLRGMLDGSPARTQVVLLDCCNAAGVHPADGDGQGLADALDTDGVTRMRCILAASGAGEPSYEQRQVPPRNDHSLFTDAVIAGLDTGDADIDADGVVSMADLAAYVERELHVTAAGLQAPVLSVQPREAAGIAFSRVPREPGSETLADRVPLVAGAVDVIGVVRAQELDAPLRVLSEPVARLRDTLMRTLRADDPGGVEAWLLDGVTQMLEGDMAFVCEGPRWELSAHSSVEDGEVLLDRARWAVARLHRVIDGTAGSTAGWRDTAEDGTEIIAVPLTPLGVARWLFVVGSRMPERLLIEPVATVCRAVCESHGRGDAPNPLRALCAAWDGLRRRAGFVPREIYRERLRAFLDQLAGVEAHFQPVLYLDPHQPCIDSWEALAREVGGRTNEAPAHLFASAELWGREFMLLLDQHMLRTAVGSYRRQMRDVRMPWRGRPHPQGLTVNVYPDTLLHNDYFQEVQETLAREAVQGRELTLEISEKRPIPDPPPGVSWPAGSTTVFRDRLRYYAQGLDVRLAIDDFGVGHGSLERLTDLSLTYVKLDQWFTQQPDPALSVGFVKAMISAKSLDGEKVVVEGFQNAAPFRLEEAFALKVRFVQGAFVGLAHPELKLELEHDRAEQVRRAADRVSRRAERPRRITGNAGDLPPRVPGIGRTEPLPGMD